jgi:hypothetical protein
VEPPAHDSTRMPSFDTPTSAFVPLDYQQENG